MTKPRSSLEEGLKGEPMGQDVTVRRVAPAKGLAGMLWFAGWLFTVGFAKLVWWKALLGLAVWPYFLAASIR
jgi:hypothetical protein